jgi:hypothetical protein
MGGGLPVDKGDYFSRTKEDFLMKMQQQGYDLFQMQDFLESKGLYSFDTEVLAQQMHNPGYINPLKNPHQPMPNPPVAYNYVQQPGQPMMGQQPGMMAPQAMAPQPMAY